MIDSSLRNIEFTFREHFVKRGDGNGGWTMVPSRYSMWNFGSGKHLFGYGVHLMENDEVIFIGALHEDSDSYRCIAAFSEDGGSTWTDPVDAGVYGRPVATAYVGGGTVLFANETLSRKDIGPQWTISTDYGRTWRRQGLVQASEDGRRVFGEGDVFVDRRNGGSTRLIQTVASHGPNFPFDRHVASVRFSDDLGKTWNREISPPEWVWEVPYQGKTIGRSVCEGTIVRARNGWLVAALRTDVPPRYTDLRYDNLMGIATSVSTDDGATWSKLNFLYEAGRHHTNLILLPGGDIALTHIVRLDVREGTLASYRHGCEAVISRDNGASWDMGHTYVLDDFAYINAEQWYEVSCGHLSSTLLKDGSILTVYGHYLSRGVAFIKWRPE